MVNLGFELEEVQDQAEIQRIDLESHKHESTAAAHEHAEQQYRMQQQVSYLKEQLAKQ